MFCTYLFVNGAAVILDLPIGINKSMFSDLSLSHLIVLVTFYYIYLIVHDNHHRLAFSSVEGGELVL